MREIVEFTTMAKSPSILKGCPKGGVVNITLPRSKSIVIRCLIVNYLRNNTILPIYENDAEDVKIVHRAMQKIDINKNKFEVCEINVEDCGAAYRFLMTLLATTPGNWLLTGTPRLLTRPILPLVNFLTQNSASINKVENGWKIKGKNLNFSSFLIDDTETSQFVSALLLINKNDNLGTGCNETNPYITLTKAILKIRDFENEKLLQSADWSAAAFWFCYLSLQNIGTKLFLKNLYFDDLQNDAIISEWAKSWGVLHFENEVGIEIKKSEVRSQKPSELDFSKNQDLAQVVATLAVIFPFELTMSGLQNLNKKESNRLDILIEELSHFTQVTKHSENSITIHKRINHLPKQFHFDSYNDHRFVMAWILFSAVGEVKIANTECVKKSYPEFCSHLLTLAK